LKKILIIFGGILLLIVLAGMYKFNYLASLDGYDVDGNRIQNIVLEINKK